MELRKIIKLLVSFSAFMLLTIVVASADSGVVLPSDGLNHRAGPGTQYGIIQAFPQGTILNVESIENGWVKCTYNSKTGYVSAQYLNIRKDNVADRNGTTISRDGVTGKDIVDFASTFLGTPYRYGGATPAGFDCSGLVYYTYKHFGINLNRTSYGQATDGIWVSKDNLQLGDILCFGSGSNINHVGIYVGDGMFIHSPQTGEVVKYTSIYGSYFGNRFVTARRIIY